MYEEKVCASRSTAAARMFHIARYGVTANHAPSNKNGRGKIRMVSNFHSVHETRPPLLCKEGSFRKPVAIAPGSDRSYWREMVMVAR